MESEESLQASREEAHSFIMGSIDLHSEEPH